MSCRLFTGDIVFMRWYILINCGVCFIPRVWQKALNSTTFRRTKFVIRNLCWVGNDLYISYENELNIPFLSLDIFIVALCKYQCYCRNFIPDWMLTIYSLTALIIRSNQKTPCIGLILKPISQHRLLIYLIIFFI